MLGATSSSKPKGGIDLTAEEKDKSLAKGLGKNLKFLRESKGLTQEKMALDFGVKQSTVANWENGSRCPGLYHLCLMKQFFDVDLYELIYGQLKPPVPAYAKNLSYLRKKHGMTQNDIANLLGVSKATSCKYENGNVEPTIAQITTLADFFGVTMDQIIKQDLSQEVRKDGKVK